MEEYSYLLSFHNQLDGKRILLRPVVLSDAKDMYEYASDEETVRFVFEKHQDIAETRKKYCCSFYERTSWEVRHCIERN